MSEDKWAKGLPPKVVEVVKRARKLAKVIDIYGGIGWSVPEPDQKYVRKLRKALEALGIEEEWDPRLPWEEEWDRGEL